MPDPAFHPAPSDAIVVDDPVVACDGGVGALGHPRVWLRIPGKQTFCPYCSRVYVLRDGTGGGPSH